MASYRGSVCAGLVIGILSGMPCLAQTEMPLGTFVVPLSPAKKEAQPVAEWSKQTLGQAKTIWTEGNEVIFKADIASDASSVIYLEGVWTNPGRRSQGYGLRCMSQLGRTLLRSTRSICVLVNEKNKKAHTFYQRAGYRLRAVYDTIFLN